MPFSARLRAAWGCHAEVARAAAPGPHARARVSVAAMPTPSALSGVTGAAIRLLKHKRMHEEQRNMLYDKTYNLDQVAFAAVGLKDAQQTMNAMNAANEKLKGMMKTAKIDEIDNMQDEMTDLMDANNEIQETLGDVDEEELMGGMEAAISSWQ